MKNRVSVQPALFKLAMLSCSAFSKKGLQNTTYEEKVKQFPFFDFVSVEKARIVFDPKLGFDAYQNISKIFTKADFKNLETQYPNGVEIFVETSLDDLQIKKDKKRQKKKQVEKIQFHRFVARRLLEKIGQSACQIIHSHFDDLDKIFKNGKKLNAYIGKIQNLKKQYLEEINLLERGYFFKPLKTMLSDFENQLATLICNFKDPSTLNTKEEPTDELKPYLDRKRIQFQQALFELKKQQFKTFTPRGKLLESDAGFASDILIIQPKLDNQCKWDFIKPANYSFYKRHYLLTEKQKKEIQYEGDQTVPSASSHTPHPMLPNYAEVEHGQYKNNSSNPRRTKTISYTRCGSAAPIMYYKQKKHDRHKARYLTYLNMQQQMMLSGVKIPSGEKLSPQSKGMSQPNNPQPVIHLHNHLITPTGVGSFSENQKDQYLDMRLMAYAINGTLNSDNTEHDKKNQYLYFCQGVNWARQNHSNDTKDTQIKNNKRVLVELFFQSKIVDTSNLKNLENYLNELKTVEIQSKNYFKKLEEYHCFKKEAKQQWTEIQALEKYNKKEDETNIKNKRDKLNSVLEIIETKKTELDRAWNQLRASEKIMLNKAESLFEEINSSLEMISSLSYSIIEKLFSLIFELFKDAESGKYNGLLPGLMQILMSELNQKTNSHAIFSGSIGCKSNNDRTVLVASIIRELSFIIANNKMRESSSSTASAHDASCDFSKNELKLDDLVNIVKKAQKNYLKTGSYYLCMADGSGLPKTAQSLLPHADQKQLKHDGKFGNLAPHKRKTELKDTRSLIEMSMDLDLAQNKKEREMPSDQAENDNSTEKNHKTHLPLFNRIQENLPDIDSDWFPIWEQLRRYHAHTQFEKDEARYHHLSIIKQKFLSNQNYLSFCFSNISDSKYHQIFAEIHLEMTKLKLCDEDKIQNFITTEVCLFLNNKTDKSTGAGKKEMDSILKNTDLSLSQKLYELQKIAATRKNDWTAWFGNRFGFFQGQRSSALQKLYEKIMNFEPDLRDEHNQKNSKKEKTHPSLFVLEKKPKEPAGNKTQIDGSKEQPELTPVKPIIKKRHSQ